MKLLNKLIFSSFLLFLVFLTENKAFAYSNKIFFQTLPQQVDTVKRDTTKKVMKKSSLNSKLEYYAKDSVVVDRKNEVQYLYGGARVKYEGLELDAEYIKFDNRNKVIFAKGAANDKGKYLGRPIFKTNEQGSSMADSLSYNIEQGSGVVYGVFTEQEGGFFSGGRTKMQPDNEFHVKGTTYSTCNLPHPHFGIQISKGIATENHIITGPVYMKFEDIPMPLGLPFAFFPKPNKKASGFILPTPGEDATKGFSLLGGGYYMAFNDYLDARVLTNIYTNGSYDLNLISNYTKRYKYNGNLNFTYSSTRNGLEGTPEYAPQKTFMIGWSHSQGANARPGTTFSASVNAGSSSHNQVTAGNGTYDPNRVLQNTMNSSISYGRVFGDGLFNFTSALTHSQETQNKTISLTLPNVSLNMSTISPFDSKKRVGEPKWYQKLTLGYSMNATNTVSTREDLLFSKGGFNRFTNSVDHNIPISLPFTVAKYLNFSSSLTYNEKWDFKTLKNKYILTENGTQVLTDTINGFKRGGQYSLGTSMSTKIYGIKQFKGDGAIRAMRHVMTPNISFTYKPDFSNLKYGYYEEQQYYTNDLRPGKAQPIEGAYVLDNLGNRLKYSVFPNGGPSAGEQASVGFSVDNNVELKVRNKKDTTGTGERKLAIIQGLTFSSSYNFVAEQKKLAPINFSGRSQFTEKLGINFSGAFSPYLVESYDEVVGITGATQSVRKSYRESNSYVWSDGQLPRLTNFTFSFDYSLNPEAFKKRNENVDNINKQTPSSARTPEQIDALNAISRDPNAFVDFNIPWNFSFSYSFNYSNPLGRPETRNLNNTLNFSGDFNLTPKWKIQYTSGYDFKAKNLSQTNFSIYRDLHCWDLSATWVPFGVYQSYSIDIKVKASVLQDLKLSKRKGFYTRY